MTTTKISDLITNNTTQVEFGRSPSACGASSGLSGEGLVQIRSNSLVPGGGGIILRKLSLNSNSLIVHKLVIPEPGGGRRSGGGSDGRGTDEREGGGSSLSLSEEGLTNQRYVDRDSVRCNWGSSEEGGERSPSEDDEEGSIEEEVSVRGASIKNSQPQPPPKPLTPTPPTPAVENSNHLKHTRKVTIERKEGILGISVRGGAEHSLPLIISKLIHGSPAALCGQVQIGDAIVAINGCRIRGLNHDSAVDLLASSGPIVTLKLKFISDARTYLSSPSPPLSSSQGSSIREFSNIGLALPEDEVRSAAVGDNDNVWCAMDNEASASSFVWEEERRVPLKFAYLTRYTGSTDILRVNGFEVMDGSRNISTGVIYCQSSVELTSWIKLISETIWEINTMETKLLASTSGVEIFYTGWVAEGTSGDTNPDLDRLKPSIPNNLLLEWKSKFLTIRGTKLYYTDNPPGFGYDMTAEESTSGINMLTTLFRLIPSSELIDGRQNCFNLQISLENSSFPVNKQAPLSLYLSTETRQELLRIETGWSKGIKHAVKSIKKTTYSVWWSGRPCQFELDYVNSSFNLYRSSSSIKQHSSSSTPSTPAPLWTRKFSQLLGSSDDGRTKLRLKFKSLPDETFECRDLHCVLFGIHSFLFARVLQ